MKDDFVFGIHAVAALLTRSPERIAALQVLEGRADQRMQQVLADAERNGIRVERVSRAELDKLEVRHQGVVAQLTHQVEYQEADIETIVRRSANPLLLILDGVTDPHNLGAC